MDAGVQGFGCHFRWGVRWRDSKGNDVAKETLQMIGVISQAQVQTLGGMINLLVEAERMFKLLYGTFYDLNVWSLSPIS